MNKFSRKSLSEPEAAVEAHLVSLLAPSSFEAEQYRALRHALEQRYKTGTITVVAVSSPVDGDGKTTTAINLAGTLAQAHAARVLLVDADLRWPSVADHLGLSHSTWPGLAEAILDPELTLEQVVRRCPPFNFSVLVAGRAPAVPYEVLKSPRLGELFEAARARYDYVVLDTPPLVPVPDCRLIAKWIDGFLLVVAAHKTPRKLVEEALNVMDPTQVMGLVFNGDDRPLSGYYGYYYVPGPSLAGSAAGRWGLDKVWPWKASRSGARPGHERWR